ncbi:hypothetical protein EON82_21615 [bacterium]|nr:MAG: hypothetical protein EON82_21615 [bacterium]
MGIQCVSDSCEHPIAPDWDFCPACGKDNRPPAARRNVPHHHHRWIIRTGYCVRCGEPADEPYSFGYRWRVRAVALLISLGSLGILAVGFIHLGRWLPNSPIGRWVGSWYSNPVVHTVGRRYRRTTYTTELGNDLSLWLGLGGAFLLALGILMLLKVPFSDGDDETTGWRIRRW